MGPLTCPFCNPPAEEIVLQNPLCYARYDKFPASPGHLLLIPYRHIASLFDATDAEQAALLALVREAKTLLDDRLHPDGYNVGVNVGTAAGQTVMHLHVHVIPRYAGDVEDPRGGVRGAIPERRVYREDCTGCREESVNSRKKQCSQRPERSNCPDSRGNDRAYTVGAGTPGFCDTVPTHPLPGDPALRSKAPAGTSRRHPRQPHRIRSHTRESVDS